MENEQKAEFYRQVVGLELSLEDGFLSEWITFHFDQRWEASTLCSWMGSRAVKDQVAIPWFKRWGIQCKMVHEHLPKYQVDLKLRKVLCRPYHQKDFNIEDLKIEKERREKICHEKE